MKNMKSRVALMPHNNLLRHVFCILRKGDRRYKCIRREAITFPQALAKAIGKGYTICYIKDVVPNSINILNFVKEVMRCRGIQYDANYNNVETSYDFVSVVKEVMEDNYFK